MQRTGQPLQPQELQRLVDAWDTRYRPGVGTHVPQGAGPARSESLARYRAQDVVRPPLARRHPRVSTSIRLQPSLARTDPVDEWLQVALALSIEIFLGEPCRSFCNRERLGSVNGSIRG